MLRKDSSSNQSANFENAERHLVRDEVKKEPLLPLFEAIHNALQSSFESDTKEKKIVVKIGRENPNENILFGAIKCFSIIDFGVGFNDRKTSAFFELFTDDKRESFNCKGIGRLTYFSAFKKIEIDSGYKFNGGYYRRKFSPTFKMLSERNIPESIKSSDEIQKTEVCLSEPKLIFFDKLTKSPESVKNALIDYFASTVISNQNISIEVEDIIKYKIDSTSLSSFRGQSFLLDNHCFDVYHIKNLTELKSNHAIVLSASGRKVEERPIDFLPKTKIWTEDERFYLKSIVTSKYLDEKANVTRSKFNIPEYKDLFDSITIEDIYSNALSEARRYVEQVVPNIEAHATNVINRVVKELPHLGFLSDEKSIKESIPILSKKQVVREILVKEFTARQVQSLNYVTTIEKKYKKQGIPNFDDFLKEAALKLEAGIKLNHASLVTYIKYRECVIDLFFKFLEKKGDEGYQHEKVLHDLLFPRGLVSENADIDYDKHNLWIFDDRYAAYNFISSHKYEGTISDKKRDKDDKQYDFFASYADPIGEAHNVFIVELKRTHDKLSRTNDPIDQIMGYVMRIQDGKIDRADGKRVFTTKNTQFYGVVLCDTEDEHFKEDMIRRYSLKQRADFKSYFTLLLDGQLFLEVMAYENLLEICKTRNKIFIDKLNLK